VLLRAKTLVAAALTAVGLVPFGAPPAHAMVACHVASPGAHSELGQIVLVAGAYKGPATAVDVVLTCGVVYNNGTVARVTDKLVGPAAALADVRQVYQRGVLTPCHEITITYLDGSIQTSDTCP
jgi:hypothetical protein